jgi:uncharacterized membrane protein YbjE (DUF340 family)
MLIVILVMISGMLVGYAFRRFFKMSETAEKRLVDGIGSFLKLTIWLLLFVLGVQVGSDEHIMSSLHTLGLEALVIGLLATLGSCIGAWMLWRYVSRKGGQA